MAESYSTNLQTTLIGTGDLAGTWGSVTNTNLGTLLEQSIAGYVVQQYSSDADVTLTIANGADAGSTSGSTIYTTGTSSAPVSARNMYIELQCATGITLTTTRQLLLPANKKLYLIYNNTVGGQSINIAINGGTGTSVVIPNGQRAFVVCDGTNIVLAETMLAPINGTPIGNTTPSTGVFTSLQTTSFLQQGSSGNYYSAILTASLGVTNASIAFVTTNGSATTAGTTLGNTDFYGFNGISYAYAGSIDFNALEASYGGTTWSSTSTPSELAFNVTAPGSTAPLYVGRMTYTGLNGCAIGATVPSTGAFSNLSAVGTISLTAAGTVTISSGASAGAINNMSIGATTPSTGAFTALTAPTRTAGDNTTNAATTAFVSTLVGGTTTATSSLSANGYQKFPSGLIMQWGSSSVGPNATLAVTLPTAFTTGGYSVVATIQDATSTTTYTNAIHAALTSTTQITLVNTNASGVTVMWQVMGK